MADGRADIESLTVESGGYVRTEGENNYLQVLDDLTVEEGGRVEASQIQAENDIVIDGAGVTSQSIYVQEGNLATVEQLGQGI